MQDTESVKNSIQVVIFGLKVNNAKKEYYGVSVDLVREIRFVENITIMPKAPNYIRGVMNLRGKVIPVIDTKKRLGFDGSDGPKSRVLIVDTGSKVTGFLVDEVDQVIRVPVKDIESNSHNDEPDSYVKAIAKIDQRLVVLLDIENLLDENHLQKDSGKS